MIKIMNFVNRRRKKTKKKNYFPLRGTLDLVLFLGLLKLDSFLTLTLDVQAAHTRPRAPRTTSRE
jgi:hypothetical protein